MTSADEQIPFEFEFVVDDGYTRRISRAIVTTWVARTLTVFLAPALLVLLAVALFVVDQPIIALVLLAVAIVLGLLPLLVYLQTRRRLEKALPVGSVLRSGFGKDAFVISEPDATSTIRYTVFRSPRVRGEFIVLRQRLTRQDVFYPAQLFPESARERIATAR